MNCGRGRYNLKSEHINLILGSLLHDIGKIIFRAGERKNHSESGYEYLKNELGFGGLDSDLCSGSGFSSGKGRPGSENSGMGGSENGRNVLDCVRYHHSALLKNAKKT